jgi:hypothetical protein
VGQVSVLTTLAEWFQLKCGGTMLGAEYRLSQRFRLALS